MTCIAPGCTNEATGLYCDACRIDAAVARATKKQRDRLEPTEAGVRVAIKSWYRLHGAHVWDTEQNRADPRVDAGLADLIVLWPGRGVRFVETKSRTGRQRDSQEEFQSACAAAGVPYLLARSVEDVERWERSET